MDKIKTDEITARQKLIIKNGINNYLFIMEHHGEDDEDFRAVFYDFYLKARSAVFAKKKKGKKNPVWDEYFDLLRETEEKTDLKDILEKMHKFSTEKSSWEFSFATKTLHTKNPKKPIYDSKVHTYLEEEVGLKFTWKLPGAKKKERILSDYEKLEKWYAGFLRTDEAKEWLKWFDKNFPEGVNISDLKKIDFIIFACTETK